MKKKLVLLLLAGMMMFGTCTNVYAAAPTSTHSLNSTGFYVKSVTSTWYVHEHNYTVNIKAYTSNNSANKTVTVSRELTAWEDVFENTLYPSTYATGGYTGRLFTGNQQCKVTVDELEYVKIHTGSIN